MDYHLEHELGTYIMSRVNKWLDESENINIIINYIGLTSTEDKIVHDEFISNRAKLVLVKPLRKDKVIEIIQLYK